MIQRSEKFDLVGEIATVFGAKICFWERDRLLDYLFIFASKLYKSIKMKCYTIILFTIISSKSAYTEDHIGSNLP